MIYPTVNVLFIGPPGSGRGIMCDLVRKLFKKQGIDVGGSKHFGPETEHSFYCRMTDKARRKHNSYERRS